MSERVRIYVGDRKKPTISFDLQTDVNLVDALLEIIKSLDRRMIPMPLPSQEATE